MDPVSKILAERERARPTLVPWFIAAALLHAGLASAVWVAGRMAPTRPPQLPAVSVKLIRPEPPRRSRPAGSPAKATAVPVPTAAPTAIPTAPPDPKPEPEPVHDTDEPVVPPSDSAMAAPDSDATPAPTKAPAPAGGEGGSSGLSLGSGASGGDSGIPSDFQFTYYIERMLALIESRWYKPQAPPGSRARVRFTILTSGKVEAIQLEETSGLPAFDRAALRALYAANPLPPLPPAYRRPSLTIHLSFSE